MSNNYQNFFRLKRGRMRYLLVLGAMLVWLAGQQQAVAQELNALSLPQCYLPAPAARIVVSGSSCTQYPE